MSEEPSVINTQKLEKNLHLQGDEEYFDEFSCTAEDAMDFLGIRRTRLRDISGHELRVGRKREGRYVRPFYRKCDLEEYRDIQEKKASSARRQGASFQMLSSVIENQSVQITTQVESELKSRVETLANQTNSTFSKLEEFVSNQNLKLGFRLGKRIDELNLNVKSMQSNLTKEQLNVKAAMDKTADHLELNSEQILSVSVEQKVLKNYLLQMIEQVISLEDSLEKMARLLVIPSPNKHFKLQNSWPTSGSRNYKKTDRVLNLSSPPKLKLRTRCSKRVRDKRLPHK